jgi:hypothetical protein
MLIVVLGLLAAVGVGLAKQYGWTQRQDTSQEMIARVEEALANYRALNSKLPCPARMDMGPTDDGFGVGDCNASSVSSPHSVAAVTGRDGRAVKIGSVPVRSLNLPDNAMLDGWGRRLVYAVTEFHTLDYADFDANEGAIEIVDSAGQTMTPSAPGSVIYAVLSPGTDGRGAYTLDGVKLADCESGTEAFENCDMNNAIFTSSVLKQYDTGSKAYTSSVKYAVSEQAYSWYVPPFHDCKCNQDVVTLPYTEVVSPPRSNVTINGHMWQVRQQETEPIQCHDRLGNVVDDSHCKADEKPEHRRSCTAYCWIEVEPPPCGCDMSCGSVHCERGYDHERMLVTDHQQCTSFTGFQLQVPCIECPPCPPPPSDDGGDMGGGYVDTDGDGKGDTHVSNMPGNYSGPTSSTKGGGMDGSSTKSVGTAMNGGTYYNYGGNHNGGTSSGGPLTKGK